MIIKELLEHIESFPNGHVFDYSLSNPFSWRSSYDEVAFSILDIKSTKEDVLAEINKVFNETFTGWKGGEYSYDNHTTVNFEESEGSYSDGSYLGNKFLLLAFK